MRDFRDIATSMCPISRIYVGLLCCDLSGGECLFEMGTHTRGSLGEVTGSNRLDDSQVLAAPFTHATAVEITAELEKPSQAVLGLDRLGKEGVAAGLGAHFMKRRIGLKQLHAVDRGDVRVRRYQFDQ